jgi:hypothetical protein
MKQRRASPGRRSGAYGDGTTDGADNLLLVASRLAAMLTGHQGEGREGNA